MNRYKITAETEYMSLLIRNTLNQLSTKDEVSRMFGKWTEQLYLPFEGSAYSDFEILCTEDLIGRIMRKLARLDGEYSMKIIE